MTTELPAPVTSVSPEYVAKQAKKLAKDLQRLGLLCLICTGERPDEEVELEAGLPVSGKYRHWSADQKKLAVILALEEVGKLL